MDEEGDRGKLILGAIVIGIILIAIVFFVVRGITTKKSTQDSSFPAFTVTPTPSWIMPTSVTPTPMSGQTSGNGTTKGGLTYPNQTNKYVQPTYYYQQSQSSGNTSGSQSQSGATQTQTLPNGMTQTQSY